MEYKLYSEILTKNLLVHSKYSILCSIICSKSCVLSFSLYFKLSLLCKGRIKTEHMACNWGSKISVEHMIFICETPLVLSGT